MSEPTPEPQLEDTGELEPVLESVVQEPRVVRTYDQKIRVTHRCC